MNDSGTARSLVLMILDNLEPSERYMIEEIRSFGFQNEQEFNRIAVRVDFRLISGEQRTPVRVWFRKDEVPEDEWVRHGRLLAEQLVGLRD